MGGPPLETRILIDGYAVMFALGLPGRPPGADGFRDARMWFLDNLAERYSPVAAGEVTVVFDGEPPSEDMPRPSTHNRMTIVFADDKGCAGDRIVRLISEHAAPRVLTVVSSDAPVRLVALRRGAAVLLPEDFLDRLEARRTKRSAAEIAADAAQRHVRELPPGEAGFWRDPSRYLGTPGSEIAARRPRHPIEAGARPPGGFRITIGHLAMLVAIAALLLTWLRHALRSQLIAVFSAWFLSPLVLTPFVMVLPPATVLRLIRIGTIAAFFVLLPLTLFEVSGGPTDQLTALLLLLAMIWLALALAYGYMASLAWSRRKGVRTLEDGSPLSPRRRQAKVGRPWSG